MRSTCRPTRARACSSAHSTSQHTRHTSHITRHTSHATRHTSPPPSLSAEPSCNPYAAIVSGDYNGLRLYSHSLCSSFAGACLVPGSYTHNCSSFASQAVTEQLNVVAVHAHAQALLPGARAGAAVFVVGGNETMLFSPTQALKWRKECVPLFTDPEP